MYEPSLSFFSSYRFLGRQRIGSVKVQAKLKCNARGYYTTQMGCGGNFETSHVLAVLALHGFQHLFLTCNIPQKAAEIS